MDSLEKLLIEEKENLDKIEIPNNMEDKLRSTLNRIPLKKRRFHLKSAAIIIMVLLLGYNMDTLAYYAKKLVGHEYIMDGTLYQLNKLGKGQSINKSYVFNDGLEVVLDGVMLDDNNLIVFYTINDPYKDVRNKDIHVTISGLFSGAFSGGGAGNTSSDEGKMSWVISTDRAPKALERTIKLNIDYRHEDGTYENGEISFKLDRNQAVGKSIKMNINKKLELGNRSIKIDTMVTSPTTTVVRGEVQNLLELGLDHFTDNVMRPENIQMELRADGKNISVKSSGHRTDHKGSTFHITFDALPAEVKEIELKLVNFSGDYDVKETFEINKEGKTEITALEEDIVIENVYEEEGNTYITFKTDEDTQLSRVYLIIDGERQELLETIHGDIEKIVDGDSTKFLYTRTMKYKGTGDKLELDIQRMRISKNYDELIYSK